MQYDTCHLSSMIPSSWYRRTHLSRLMSAGSRASAQHQHASVITGWWSTSEWSVTDTQRDRMSHRPKPKHHAPDSWSMVCLAIDHCGYDGASDEAGCLGPYVADVLLPAACCVLHLRSWWMSLLRPPTWSALPQVGCCMLWVSSLLCPVKVGQKS